MEVKDVRNLLEDVHALLFNLTATESVRRIQIESLDMDKLRQLRDRCAEIIRRLDDRE